MKQRDGSSMPIGMEHLRRVVADINSLIRRVTGIESALARNEGHTFGVIGDSLVNDGDGTASWVSLDHVALTKSGQSVATGAGLVEILFDTEEYDTNGLHSLSVDTGRITAVQKGYYKFTGYVSIGGNATGTRQIGLYKNGSGGTLIGASNLNAVAANTHQQSFAGECHLNAGEYVNLYVAHNAGVSLSVTARLTGSMNRVD